jgi:hypothetical protein
MEKLTQATARLTPAEAYNRQAAHDRRTAAIERQRVEIQADIARLNDLYANGSLTRPGAKPKPQFKEATRFTVERLAGGLDASVAADKAAVTRRTRAKDTSPEAEEKRARRRARRLARKQRQAAALG